MAPIEDGQGDAMNPLPGTDLWETSKQDVTTRDWEMFDIVHAVLPTKLSLEEFYEEYSKLWNWSLQVRYKERGRLQTYLRLFGALVTGRVTMDAVRKGMNMAQVFSQPETFLQAHRESEIRQASSSAA